MAKWLRATAYAHLARAGRIRVHPRLSRCRADFGVAQTPRFAGGTYTQVGNNLSQGWLPATGPPAAPVAAGRPGGKRAEAGMVETGTTTTAMGMATVAGMGMATVAGMGMAKRQWEGNGGGNGNGGNGRWERGRREWRWRQWRRRRKRSLTLAGRSRLRQCRRGSHEGIRGAKWFTGRA